MKDSLLGVLACVCGALVAVPALAAQEPAGAVLATHEIKFDDGAEFPGAKGQADVADGELRLTYDFSGGGHYVGAIIPLPEKPTVGQVRFKASFDETTRLTFRFTDATGQVFQQLLRGTVEGWGEWKVSLDNVYTYWGGAKDGIVRQPISEIAFLAESLTSAKGGPSGVLKIKDVRFVKEAPAFGEWTSDRSVAELTAEVESLKAQLQTKDGGSAKSRATLAVLNVFRPWVEQDVAKGWTGRAKRELLEMRRIAADELSRRARVARGEETDEPTPRYVTSRVETRGADLIADRVWPDGRRERGRVFLNGFGHFRQAQEAVDRFQALGNGYLQMEIGPSDILKGEQTSDLSALNRFRKVADACASNNVQICLLVSPHYFPKWALEKWPDLKGCGWGFFKYCVHDERAWRILEKFLRILIPQVKGHPALHSICLSNEPVQVQWGSNCVLRTEWKGPVVESCWNPEPTQATLDWCRFNRKKFAVFHRRLAALVHELAPEIPVHAKMMVWHEFENGPTYHSVELQAFSELSDLNGNDAEDYPFADGDGLWAHRWWEMEAGYDWQRSCKDVPVINSENHIVPDHFRAYVPGNHFYTVLWQNTLHGQAATALWMWERTHSPQSMANGLVMERPECLNAWAHCSLDVSRLADVISPLRNQKPTILLHWSLASQVLSGRRGHYFLDCYRAAAFLGQPLGIVTDKTLNEFGAGGRRVRPLEEAKAILLPDFTGLEPETLAGLRRLADQGVAVRKCQGGERALFRRLCDEMGKWGLPDLPRVREPGSECGVFGVESRGYRADGKSYLSLVNHTTEPLRVHLEAAGRDLITGAKVPQEFDLKPMTPMLVEYGVEGED